MRIILTALFALLLTSCAAIKSADTIEQKAAALYGEFTIAETTAAAVVCPGRQGIPASDPARSSVPCNPTAPAGAVRAIASADSVAKPLADTMATAARAYSDARKQAASDGIVAAALQQLMRAYNDAGPSIKALVAAVNQFKESN